MNTIREEIYEIHFWSPPNLKKHRYSMNNVKTRTYAATGNATGVLMQEIQRRDRVDRETGPLIEPAPVAEVNAPADVREFPQTGAAEILTETPRVPDAAVQMPAENTEAQVKPPAKKQFRSLKKIETLIYDDTLLKLGELEDESYEELNKDGYYDELLPLDSDIDYDFEDSNKTRPILILLIVLVVLIVLGIVFIKEMF